MTRIYFTCDIHGSEKLWKKFLKASRFYRTDIVIVGGDLTGKMIVPIIERKNGAYTVSKVFEREWVFKSPNELQEFKDRVRQSGMYPYVCDYEKALEISKDKRKMDKLFEVLMGDTLRNWIEMIEKKIENSTKVIINPGNDDPFLVDEIIKNSERVIYPLEKVIFLDDYHEMISCEWTNPSPWNSPREEPEEKLEKRLERLFQRVERVESLICNFHAPPFNSNLDRAPKLDKNLRQVLIAGTPHMLPVGSLAVRSVIERHHPMLTLHGHIHESPGASRLGRTLCLNPGSEYMDGILKGVIVEVEKGEIKNYQRVEG